METIGKLVMLWCMVVGGLSRESPSSNTVSQDKVCVTKRCAQRATLIKSLMNSTVDPCGDFWHYACGGLTSNVQTIWNRMAITRSLQLIRLLSAPLRVKDPSAVKMAKTFYRSCTDIGVLQKLGDQPLIDAINGALSHFPSDLTSRLLAIDKLTISPLFGVTVTRYQADTSRYVWAVEEPALNLPRHSYVGPHAATFLRPYTQFLVKALHRLYPDVTLAEWQRRAARVVELEVAVAAITWSRQQRQQQQQPRPDVPNSHTLLSMQTAYPDIDWHRYLQGIAKLHRVDVPQTPQQVIVTRADHFIKQLFPLLRNTSSQALHDHFLASAVFHLVPYTAGSLFTLFQTFNTDIGMEKPALHDKRKRDLYCVAKTRNILAEVVGYMYAQVSSNTEQKERVHQLLKNVVRAITHQILSSPWLPAASKRFSLEKLAALKAEVAVPSLYRNASQLDRKYRGVPVTSARFFRNAMGVKHRQARWMLMSLVQPGHSLDWVDATKANAFYRDLQNRISLPAAILQPPVFSPAVPNALNYGSLGMIMGHEVSHALDFRGQQYDQHGNLRGGSPLHDPHDHNVYCLQHQFDNFTFRGVSSCVNGSLTWNENFADSAGLGSAYIAFDRLHSSRAQKTLPGLSQLSPDQLFFLSFAQIWCSKDSYSASSKFCRARSDEHSPSKVRALATLINTPQFARAFSCPLGSPMNPLTDKCHVWGN